jgi:hypothetical protein
MGITKPPFEIGTRFGDWEVIEQLEEIRPSSMGQKRFALSRVRCAECGIERILHNNYLRAGGSRGCGCRRSRALGLSRAKHRKSNTPNYKLWRAIKQRLKFEARYHGVKMHEPWVHEFIAFDAFIEGLGPKPTPQHTLDRIDSAGHYEPGNLRWADKKTQTENRRPFGGYRRGSPVFHAKTRTPIYTLWRGIKQRLRQQSAYRGIRLHEAWEHDFLAFETFIMSLGPKPTPQHTLDRIDPTGHYEPGNLRWADKKTQSENRRNNKFRTVLEKSIVSVGEKHGMLTVMELLVERRHGVTWYCAKVRCDCGTEKVVYQKQLLTGRTRSCGCYRQRNLRLGHLALEKPIEANGRSMSMSAWARETGISAPVIWHRIHRYGWDPARAVTEPLQIALIEINGESRTAAEWSGSCGVPGQTITKRITKGWDPAAAVTTPVRAWGRNRKALDS